MTTLDRVFVRNADGTPLAPTRRFAKVRKLLASGKATIYCHEPFTIQYTEQLDISSPVKQYKLGIDVGSKYIGFSVVDEEAEQELIAMQVDVLEGESKRISKRREARRTRRHYTVRHRKPRFDNRRRKAGWLPPSIQHKLDIHEDAIDLLMDILPIGTIRIEAPAFDTHKLVNPDVQGEDYQNGPQKGYKNVREYVLDRDGHRCQASGCESTKHLQVHHIESRQTGGNSPGNLITLCDSCHAKYHNKEIDLSNIERLPSFKHASQATVIGAALIRDLFNKLSSGNVIIEVSDGWATAQIRKEHGLPKTHVVDARVIAGGADVEASTCVFHRRKVRRHNRHYYKANLLKGGRKKRNTGAGEVEGFKRFDIVRLDGRELCFIDSLRSNGYFKLRRLDGSLVVTSRESSKQKDSSVSYKRQELVRHANGYMSWKEM